MQMRSDDIKTTLQDNEVFNTYTLFIRCFTIKILDSPIENGGLYVVDLCVGSGGSEGKWHGRIDLRDVNIVHSGCNAKNSEIGLI